MINGDVLNGGQEIKISQGEFTLNSDQLPTRAYRFATVSSSICLFPSTSLTKWVSPGFNSPGFNTDYREKMVTHNQNHLHQLIIHNESLNIQRRKENNISWHLLRNVRHFTFIA